ncbi:DUF1311 domain-containing protein [Alteromonas genovensis]|uniref:DUF1311 domain-containing protein n=1 Tax=Alteromonas genovensis TaxID=471225 RepID=A0A6N9TE88_9ALTE|nr:lysozyme inhibitor LprI family protein [Alteromonas genovensis]NDW15471.1 DUF1311 domain-containing protein [Alteromonas genovensis]
MKFIITFSLLLVSSSSLFANEFPSSIDYFTSKGIKGKFIEIHDPGYIVIKLDTGDVIDTTYSDIDFDKLYEWEKNDQRTNSSREMSVIYNNTDGILVEDLKTGIKFKLNGVLTTHPIDLAADECEGTFSDTVGIKQCRQLVLEAWDAELNRAYKNLGGSKNTKLKSSQLAWIKFRDAQLEYLRSEYGSRSGTIWGIVYMGHVINLTKEQAKRLKLIKEW